MSAQYAETVQPAAGEVPIADVCLIVEGAYPYVAGGVSSWVDGLMRRHSSLRFQVVTILPDGPPPVSKYAAPPNLDKIHHLYLSEVLERGWRGARAFNRMDLFAAVDTFLRQGNLEEAHGPAVVLHPVSHRRRVSVERCRILRAT